jgi:hypothetical protein
MSSLGRELLESFDHLPEPEKREVASAIIRRTFALDRNQIDEAHVAALYAEFADDDRLLAEDDIQGYERGLAGEDAQ